MKLAMAFVISRLLKINDEESWDESSIGMLHSSLEQRNVGKSLTMELLAKGKVPNRRHPSMLAGGNQCQTGASVEEIVAACGRQKDYFHMAVNKKDKSKKCHDLVLLLYIVSYPHVKKTKQYT
ncbi:uncharacterized protein LOC144648718 [Oculina patagonica]